MNWPALISELQALGYTQTRIAELCGCNQPTINDIAKGRTNEPRYGLGDALVALHKKATAQAKRKAKQPH